MRLHFIVFIIASATLLVPGRAHAHDGGGGVRLPC